MSDNPVDGEIFSRNYLRPQAKLSDSMRARRRTLAVFRDVEDSIGSKFVAAAQRELGVDYPSSYYGYLHEEYWTECEVRDFLGSVTLVHRLLRPLRRNDAYLQELRNIFRQENLRYRIDDDGGVHYLVDEQFAWVTEATLHGLGSPRFAGARQALESGLQALSAENLSGKALIRGVFEAAESTFLVLVGAPERVNRLNARAVEAHLQPLLMQRYEGVPEAEDKVSRAIATFNSWVNSAHPYRHGAAFEDIHEAPLDEAILQASIGMAFIRYMVGGDI